ncbi:MAG: hypothetical protein F6J89_18755 [Symploca sp. SIO1C4]|uniref:Uncharacterized protein n=1 Tax=Symploca sp. SIO1C4 TaxID=2607765 RepID=A0A6B3NIX9_9CYAN|nr:hypothetical protein [Symploca sp. SIO1C4]NET04744.1 hypothetical protein [Symploca sp. SIO2B6]
MYQHSSIVLASLLFSNLVTNFPKLENHSKKLHHPDFVHQKLLTIQLNHQGGGKNCEQNDEHSPERGCGRREHD